MNSQKSDDLTEQCLNELNEVTRHKIKQQQRKQMKQREHDEGQVTIERENEKGDYDYKICGLCGMLIGCSNFKRHWDRSTHVIWKENHRKDGKYKFELTSFQKPPLAKHDWFEKLPPEYQNKLLPTSPSVQSLPSTFDSDIHQFGSILQPKNLQFCSPVNFKDTHQDFCLTTQENPGQRFLFNQVNTNTSEDQVNFNCRLNNVDGKPHVLQDHMNQREIYTQNEKIIPLLESILHKMDQGSLLQKRASREEDELEDGICKRVKISEYQDLIQRVQSLVEDKALQAKEKQDLEAKLKEQERKYEELLLKQSKLEEKMKEEKIAKMKTAPVTKKMFSTTSKIPQQQTLAESLKDYGGKLFGRTLLYESINALDGKYVLNDEIIDFFYWFFFETISKQPFKSRAKVLECTVSALLKTKIQGGETNPDFRSGKTELKNIIQENGINFLIMPFNVQLSKNSAHWILIILANISKRPQKYWEKVNISGQVHQGQCLIILDSFKQTQSYYIVSPFCKDLMRALGYDETNYKIFNPNVPQQNNHYDCGAFIIEYAERFISRPHYFLSSSFLKPSKFEKRKDLFDIKIMDGKRKELIFLLMQLFNLDPRKKERLSPFDRELQRIVESYLEGRTMPNP